MIYIGKCTEDNSTAGRSFSFWVFSSKEHAVAWIHHLTQAVKPSNVISKNKLHVSFFQKDPSDPENEKKFLPKKKFEIYPVHTGTRVYPT
jgi:hypothetical protein